MFKNNSQIGNYPSTLIVLSLALALLLVGLCGWFGLNYRNLTKNLRQRIELQVSLKNEVSAQQLDSLAQLLSQKPFVANEGLQLITKEQTAKQFVAETGEDYTKILENNPFFNLFLIQLKDAYITEQSIQTIKQELLALLEVHEVSYPEKLLKGFTANFSKLYLIFATFILLLLIAILILINNTIRLALFSQRFLIRSMQLVGATNGFIRFPFVKKSLWQGALAGVLASLGVFITQKWTLYQVPEMVILHDDKNMILLYFFLLVLGVFIAFLSTLWAVSVYLDRDLDKLYA